MKRVFYDLEDLQENVIYGGLTVNQIRARLGINKHAVHRGIYRHQAIGRRWKIHKSEYEEEEIELPKEDGFARQFNEKWERIQSKFARVEWLRDTNTYVNQKPNRISSNSVRYGMLG